MTNFTEQLFEHIMYAVAHRIATLAQTNAQAAANDYEQHAREMSIDERADFDNAIVQYAIEIGV